jgi:hypothetical protein
MSDLGVAPVVVVAVREVLGADIELVEVGEGVPVVVLVFEDAPEQLRRRVAVESSGAAHRPDQSHRVALGDGVLGGELTGFNRSMQHRVGADYREVLEGPSRPSALFFQTRISTAASPNACVRSATSASSCCSRVYGPVFPTTSAALPPSKSTNRRAREVYARHTGTRTPLKWQPSQAGEFHRAGLTAFNERHHGIGEDCQSDSHFP